MKKNDLLLIGALLILCGIAAVFFFARTDSAVRHAVITQDGRQLYDIPLTGHTGTEDIRIADAHGENIVRIEGETISVIDADCPTSSVSRRERRRRKGTSLPASRINC